MDNKKIRESNFELMRVIAMIYIVITHIILNGSGMLNLSPKVRFIIDIIQATVVIHVNSFIIVSGYFQSTKENTNNKKLLNILGVSWFYRIIALIIYLSFIGTLSNLEVLRNLSFLPLGHEHWFIHYYILLYLISPYLNKLIKSLDQEHYKKFLLLLFFICSLLPYLTNQLYFTLDGGFSLYHFIYLYFIGGYLRKYPIKDSYHFKDLSLKGFRLLCVVVYFLCIFIDVSILYFGKYIYYSVSDGGILSEIGLMLMSVDFKYEYPTVIIQSIAFFLFFSTFSFKSKIINRISACTLGIYMIHELELVKYHFFNLFPFSSDTMTIVDVLLQMLGLLILIFGGCLIIELTRSYLFKWISLFIKNILNKKKIIKHN